MSEITNVNDQFDAQKFAQINAPGERLQYLRDQVAAGNMSERDNGDNTATFTVLSGWDRNETFTASLNERNVQILANHGLDTKENGETALYLMSDTPAWHGLGQVIPEGLRTGADVLKAAGLDWTVEKVPSEYTDLQGVRRINPDSFQTIRSDNGASLGAVGTIYYAFQNMVAYSILDELLGFGMIAKSAGSLRGGRKIFVSAEIPSDLRIDPGGVDDQVTHYVNLINTHDGSGSFIAANTPWFARCANTARLAVEHADATFKIRHTKGGLNKIDEARRVLGLSTEYAKAFVEEETALARTPFTTDDLDALITEIWGTPGEDASKREVTLDGKRREGLHAVWEMELGRLGATAFAAENAVTGYLDHLADLKPRGELKGKPRSLALGQALIEDTTGDRKNAAHAVLMRRVRG